MRTADDHGFAQTDPIGDPAHQRCADDPAQRHRRRTDHRRPVLVAMRVLQVTHSPDHVEDRGRDEEQARDRSAQKRLRIAKHRAQRAKSVPQPVAARAAGSRAREQREQKHAQRDSRDAHADPELAPRHARGDQRPHDELARRAAGHAEHLRRADQGRGARRRKALADDVDGSDEREDSAGALQKAPHARRARIAEAEQQRARPDERSADRHHAARPEPIERHTGDQTERRVAEVEEPDQRPDAHRAEAEGLGELRHHHARRRAQRVLIEVVDRRDQPGDRGCLAHPCRSGGRSPWRVAAD